MFGIIGSNSYVFGRYGKLGVYMIEDEFEIDEFEMYMRVVEYFIFRFSLNNEFGEEEIWLLRL